jgi:hypothetical protein
MATFVELLKGIYSPRPELREGSVENYKQMAATQPNQLVMLLLETMANDPDVQVCF